ncbi:MAG: hypothetical protein ABIR84_03970 [Candidatus Nitrotoga sp.]
MPALPEAAQAPLLVWAGNKKEVQAIKYKVAPNREDGLLNSSVLVTEKLCIASCTHPNVLLAANIQSLRSSRFDTDGLLDVPEESVISKTVSSQIIRAVRLFFLAEFPLSLSLGMG